MASPRESATDLLWAYQIKREHRFLAQRIDALEAALWEQNKRISTAETNSGAAQATRITELSKELKTLRDSDITEQIAGLAGELRDTRQQSERAREKLRDLKKTSKNDASAATERENALQARIAELEHQMSVNRVGVQSFERRFVLTMQDEIRPAMARVDETKTQHCARIGKLEEQLSRLKQTQDELRTLNMKRLQDAHYYASTSSPNPSQWASRGAGESTAQSAMVSTLPPPSRRADESAAQGSVPSLSPLPPLPPPPRPGRAHQKKKNMDKEVAQLICGEESLTNAPFVFETQGEASPPRDRKRKTVEETVQFSPRATRSQAKRLKQAPPVEGPTTQLEQPTPIPKTKATAKTSRRPQKSTTLRGNKAKKQPNLPQAALSPIRRLPLPLSSSVDANESDVQPQPVLNHSPSPTILPPPSKDKRKTGAGTVHGKAKTPSKEHPQQNEQVDQPPPQRRRRIEQDDSMEEFLAKCRAVSGA